MPLHYVLKREGWFRADEEHVGDGQTVLCAQRPFMINQAIKGYRNGRISYLTSNTLIQRIRQHQHLRDLRNKLLRLHQALLNTERITYEQVRGRVSSGELLQLVIEHEQFAWLHRISELVVQIDEMLSADEPVSLDDVQNLIADARTLIAPSEVGNGFARKYYDALQREPAAVLAHAEVSKLLTSSLYD